MPEKPLGGKAYGSIPHLIGSRRGPSDSGVNDGQQRICTERLRDKHDEVIVQLKLDGSNVAAARIGGRIEALTRAGYRCADSPYPQHHMFARYVAERADLLRGLLDEGEWLSGEWLAQAHGTRYDLGHRAPFVAFDLWRDRRRVPYDTLVYRVGFEAWLPLAPLLHRGGPCSVAQAMAAADARLYGELDPPEGAVWRVERRERGQAHVDFLAKYVRPEKVDGCYLPELSGGPAVWNWREEVE